MPTYKVEFINVVKKYSCVTVSADNRIEAISKAKEIPQDNFDDTETSEQVSWDTKREWNLFDFLLSRN